MTKKSNGAPLERGKAIAFCATDLTDAEVRARLGLPAEEEAEERPRPRRLNTDAAKSPHDALVLLNALPLWEGRLAWAAFQRRGNTLIGTTTDGEQVSFEIDKLTRFAHAQARILAALSIAIRSPRRGAIGETWLTAAELMVRAAAQDVVDVGRPEDDLQADLSRCWRLAGQPKVRSRQELAGLLRVLADYRREPHAETAPAAVFVDASSAPEACVHLPVLRQWLGTPAGGHRFLTLPALREQAALLSLKPHEVDLRDLDGGLRTTLWVGPAEVLDGI